MALEAPQFEERQPRDTTSKPQTCDARREALQFESFGHKNEQQKPNQTEEVVQDHPSSVGAGIVSKVGARCVLCPNPRGMGRSFLFLKIKK